MLSLGGIAGVLYNECCWFLIWYVELVLFYVSSGLLVFWVELFCCFNVWQFTFYAASLLLFLGWFGWLFVLNCVWCLRLEFGSLFGFWLFWLIVCLCLVVSIVVCADLGLGLGERCRVA